MGAVTLIHIDLDLHLVVQMGFTYRAYWAVKTSKRSPESIYMHREFGPLTKGFY